MEAGRRIVYSWRYGGVPGDSKVSWELAESGEGLRLTFAHTATESFDTDDPLSVEKVVKPVGSIF